MQDMRDKSGPVLMRRALPLPNAKRQNDDKITRRMCEART